MLLRASASTLKHPTTLPQYDDLEQMAYVNGDRVRPRWVSLNRGSIFPSDVGLTQKFVHYTHAHGYQKNTA